MELSVRAFIFNNEDEILLLKHTLDGMWVLPGGHIEPGETMYEALYREIDEELSMGGVIIGSDTQFSTHHVVSLPLPVSIHKIQYEHMERGIIKKLEYIFFMRTEDAVGQIQEDEVYDWKRVSSETFFAMEGGKDTYVFMQEILEQNEDLLELL